MRGKGHIPDHRDDVDADLQHRHIGLLIGSAPGVPESVDYSHFLDAVPDQGSTSACVGCAFSTSVFLRAAISGAPIARPSRKAIYDGARLVDSPHITMLDQGCRPRAAIDTMQTYGLVAESRWPLTEEAINIPPPLDVFEHALPAMLSGYYRIGCGAGASTLVRQALGKGFCPAFAMDVDAAYEDLDAATTYTGPKGPSLGGHMQCAIGCVPGAILVCNSWGTSWALAGLGFIADSFFDSGGVSDLLVCTTVPTRID